MRKLLAAGAAALILIGAASARDVWLVSEGSGAVVFVDADTIAVSKNGYTQIWSDWYDTSANGKSYLRFRELTRFDCKNRMSLTIQGIRYSESGKVTANFDDGGRGAQYVAPRTLSESVLEFVCFKSRRDRFIRVNPGDEMAWIYALSSAP